MTVAVPASSRRDYSRHVGVGVIALAALLLILTVRPFGNQVEYRKHSAVSTDIQAISTQLKLYQSMNGLFPTTDQGLEALVIQPTTNPKPQRWFPLLKSKPKDLWQHEYIYRCPGIKNPNGYDLFSAGSDGIPDTVDDDWGG